MTSQNTYHLSTAAAQQYETQKVPSVFAPLAEATFDAIELPESVRVLDVACGTGIVSKCLARRLSRKSRIVGTDLNPAMIELARTTMPNSIHTVEWFNFDVTALPFERDEFDLAFCQQGVDLH